MADERDWKAVFEEAYSGEPSKVAERVWRAVYGEAYPAGLDPYSYVSRDELHRVANELRVRDGERVVDIGCGQGGPGLWVATVTGASMIGIDISSAALEAARARAAGMGLEGRAEFREASFERTGLDTASVDGVMSIDALLFTLDKPAAIAELWRVLRPGRRVVFTSWDYHRQPVGRPPQLDDHRPYLEAAGFEVLAYDETEDWRRRMAETTEGLIDNVEELAAECGDDVDKTRIELEEMRAALDAISRRVLVVAEAR